jgi:ADP-ribose pyrophosphatase YjhB (NUDIX family)
VPRDPLPTYNFAFVVARWEGRFLLVHERKHGQTWYLPAGRVEWPETFAEAAVRETREEAGVDVELDGVVRVEHSPLGGHARMRVCFVAHPRGDPTPKAAPDEDTLGAAWVTPAEMKTLPLRDSLALALVRLVERSAPLLPMSAWALEGAPVRS